MVNLNLVGFKPVEFKRGELVPEKGGFSKKEVSLQSKEIRADGFSASYIKIYSRAPWLSWACMDKCNRGEIHLGVLKVLQDRVRDIEIRLRMGLAPLEDTASKEVDPMDELGDFEMPVQYENQKRKQNRKNKS